MAKFNFICKETIMFPSETDIRNGEYYAYLADTIDYILNDDQWVEDNDAWDERDWIIDQYDKSLESNNGEIIYIPTPRTATKIETEEELQYIKQQITIEQL